MFISRKINVSHRGLKLQINNTKMTPQPPVELLGVTNGNEFKLDQHISKLFKSPHSKKLFHKRCICKKL